MYFVETNFYSQIKYNFIPESVDNSKPGLLAGKASGEISLDLAPDIQYTGNKVKTGNKELGKFFIYDY